MIDYKEKFEKMRVAGNLAARTLDMLTENIKEGISTDYIDKLGYEFIKDNGGHSAPLYYRGFTKSLCTSLNHVVCHGIPSDRILQEGDAVNVDVTAIVDEHYGGLAFEEEGERCSKLLHDNSFTTMLMSNHGLLVIGKNVAETFNRLYYYERVAEVYVKALQTGKKLKFVPW